jgi:hypothetical protein
MNSQITEHTWFATKSVAAEKQFVGQAGFRNITVLITVESNIHSALSPVRINHAVYEGSWWRITNSICEIEISYCLLRAPTWNRLSASIFGFFTSMAVGFELFDSIEIVICVSTGSVKCWRLFSYIIKYSRTYRQLTFGPIFAAINHLNWDSG